MKLIENALYQEDIMNVVAQPVLGISYKIRPC